MESSSASICQILRSWCHKHTVKVKTFINRTLVYTRSYLCLNNESSLSTADCIAMDGEIATDYEEQILNTPILD